MANSVQPLKASALDVAQDHSHKAPSGDDHGIFDDVMDRVRDSNEAPANIRELQDEETVAQASAANSRSLPAPSGNTSSIQLPRDAKEAQNWQIASLMTKGGWLQLASNVGTNAPTIISSPENTGSDNQNSPGAASPQDVVNAFNPGIPESVLSVGGPQIVASASVGSLAHLEQSIGGASRHVASHLTLPVSVPEESGADADIPAIRVLKTETHFRPVVEGFTVQLDRAAGAQASRVAVAGPATISEISGHQSQATLLTQGNGGTSGIYDPGPDVSFAADDSASLMLETLDRPMMAPTEPQTSPMMKAIAGFIETEIGPEMKPFKPGFVEVLSPTYTISAKASQEAVRQLSIQLRPAELGVVNVSLRLAGDVLELRMEVDNEHAAKMLMRDRDGLCASLRASGYRPEVVTIVVTGAQQASEPSQQQQQSHSHHRSSDQSGGQNGGNGSGGNGAGDEHDQKNSSGKAGSENSDENAGRDADRLSTDALSL